jgi:hypothetical protein
MQHFQIHIKNAEEIIPRLGKQERHWKVGRSAYELSMAWMKAKDVPPVVRAVLNQAAEWKDATFLEGIFERETALPGRGRPSQTDLLAILALQNGNAILGVEGKVNEPFGSLVNEWLAGPEDENRRARLAGLCKTLGVEPNIVGPLYYQLLHRTCAAIYEAKRFGYGHAIMLVHSFAVPQLPAELPACFDDFRKFSRAVGMPVAHPGTVSPPKKCEGVEIRLAWASDRPASQTDSASTPE